MKKALSIGLVIYLASAAYMWNWHRVAFSKGGIWGGQHPDGMSVFMTITPFVNTICAGLCFFTENRQSPESRPLDTLFNVSK